jgi:formylglycine-generating enzyme required for sulfatase activity
MKKLIHNSSFYFLLLILAFFFLFPVESLIADAGEEIVGENSTPSNDRKEHQTEYNVNIFTNFLGMQFVNVSPASYMMGSRPDEPGTSVFEKQKEVTLANAFFIQTTEVTQTQWKEVLGNNPSYFKNCGANCPVEQVSWYDVQEFIQILNQKDSMNRYRLPTEAEWEYACRAGSTTLFANGDMSEFGCNADTTLSDTGWYFCNSEGRTHPVAQKESNSWGLYDMHGNVYEWCHNPFSVPHLSYDDIDQEDSYLGADRACRSCSWSDSAFSCRSASRINIKPEIRSNMIGFRLVREHANVYKIIKMDSPENLVSSDAEKHDAKEIRESKTLPVEITEEKKYFSVQIAATKDIDSGKSLVDRLKKLGYAAFVTEVVMPEKGLWYRIRVGRFTNWVDANQMRKKLMQDNFEGFVTQDNF